MSVVKSRNFVTKLRLENRGGKVVTLIEGLPKLEIFLKSLTRTLKARCGSGGTYHLEGKEGAIEIQGDKREQIQKLLEAEGISVKN